jgi:hypothetical protein
LKIWLRLSQKKKIARDTDEAENFFENFHILMLTTIAIWPEEE